MSFNKGDHVVCVLGKKTYKGTPLLVEGMVYVVLDVKDEDGEVFIRVTDPKLSSLNFFASRFEFANTDTSTPVIRKIRQMEQRRRAA